MRIYLDTSVVGGTCDPQYSADSLALVAAIAAGTVTPVVSDVLAGELALAPPAVQQQFAAVLACQHERCGYDPQAATLRDAYLRAGVLPRGASDDALHVAYATISRVDALVSWNFRHLANPVRVRGFNGVNIANGYGIVLILTPADVLALVGGEDDGGDEAG